MLLLLEWNRVAKTCQPVGANFSRPVLIFGQSTEKMLLALMLEAGVLVAPVQPENNTSVASTSATNTNVASTSATSN